MAFTKKTWVAGRRVRPNVADMNRIEQGVADGAGSKTEIVALTAIATANATDLATAIALANATKTTVNEIIAALKA